MAMANALEETTVRAFGAGLSGEIVRRGDATYDEARRVWNGMIDRSPALIVRCRGTTDVVAAVNFARDNSLVVAVRGGGHSAAGLAVCDDGMVIDLSGMREVQVDPDQRIARAQGGARWAEFDAATHPHGLATTGGLISTTGIGGLTLGGGIGWLMRSYGLACDNVVSAEVVTADGQVRTASEAEHADLFWAIRGAGANFGVVTRLDYRLYPVSQVLGGLMVFPVARAPEVMRRFRALTETAPDQLTLSSVLLTTPDGVPVNAILMCYNGPIAEGEQAIRPLRELGPVADTVAPMPYPALQQMLDPDFPAGLQVYWRADFLRALEDDAIEVLCERFASVPSPLSALLVEQMGGAVARVPANATAFAHRVAPFNFAIIARWKDPAQASANVAWARDVSDAMQRFTSGGVYVNYLGVGDGADRVRAAYGPEKYGRLATLKQKYDPSNLFRMNQNIRPQE